MSTEPTAQLVPLVALLRSVPVRCIVNYEQAPYRWNTIPVGRHCHDAAARIEQLERERDAWNEVGRRFVALLHPLHHNTCPCDQCKVIAAFDRIRRQYE